MAKNKDDARTTQHDAATAVAERKNRVTDIAAGAGGSERPADKRPAEKSTGGFFDIYKPSQGTNVRTWSGVAYGALVAWFAYFVYERLGVFSSGATQQVIQVVGASIILVAFGLLGYWVFCLNRRACDFLIATEGEMKKVNWTSRKEIIGSTKVVVFVLVTMSVLLFVVDVLFMIFFTWIGVLRGGSVTEMIFGK